MNKKHEKSACCRALVIKFGNRRRQCVKCRKTWSVWKKRRGRKRKRVSKNLVQEFLNRDIASVASLARKRNCSQSKIQKFLKRSRDLFLQKTSWGEIPKGQLILIADAVVEMIEGRWQTVYFMLVRPVSDCEAIILPPVFIKGTETVKGWKATVDSLEPGVKERIVAIVCDGHVGLILESKWNNWLLQRCQFHLWARIQSRRSRSKISRNIEEAKKIFEHVHLILNSKQQLTIQLSLNILEEIGWHSRSPEIRKVLAGFINNYKSYRTCLDHPELNLPTTSNTAESLASHIGDLKRRMRGFPTLNSFTLWLTAVLKHKKKVKCQGIHQQN